MFLAGALLGWTWWFTDRSLDIHHALGTATYDSALYDQGMWLLSRFEAPFVTLMGRNLFGDHTSFVLLFLPAVIAWAMQQGWNTEAVLIAGLVLFGIVFAINSAVHSYLILAYSDFDKVSMNVGFYYMANAGGRLAGTVLSGWVYQTQGLTGCLWWSTAFVLAAAVLSFRLPPVEPAVAPERMSPD